LEGADAPSRLRFRRYDIDRLSRSRTAAYHLLNENRRQLCIPLEQDFAVVDLYDTDKTTAAEFGFGRLPREVVVEYAWSEDVALQGPEFGSFEGRRVPLLCGGTLVFDERGNVLSFMRKPGTARLTDPTKPCKQDQEEGELRRKLLLEHVAGRVGRGWVRSVDREGIGSLGMATEPVAAWEVDGALQLEMIPHMRHLDDE
jgi:hypothetical protein